MRAYRSKSLVLEQREVIGLAMSGPALLHLSVVEAPHWQVRVATHLCFASLRTSKAVSDDDMSLAFPLWIDQQQDLREKFRRK